MARIIESQAVKSVFAAFVLIGALSLGDPAMAMGKKKPKPVSPHPVPVPTQPAQDDSKRDSVKAIELTQYLVISDGQVLQNDSDGALSRLVAEAKSCGIEESSPACLDSAFVSNRMFREQPVALETQSSWLLLSLFSTSDKKSGFLLVKEVEKDPRRGLVRSVSAYALPDRGLDIDSAVKGFKKGAYQKILTFSVPNDRVQDAESEIQNPGDFRKLYHYGVFLIEFSNDPDASKPALGAFRNRYREITASGSFVYDRAFLTFLRSRFAAERDLLVAVANELLSASDTDVSELAAITLGERGVASDVVLELVRRALGNRSWEFRRSAVQVLANFRAGLSDDKLLIARLADSDSDVRGAALAAVQRFKLEVEHLPALEALLGSNEWSVRRTAVNLIGKIADPDATVLLIGRLADGDSDVRAGALSQVNGRALTNRELPHLRSLLSSQEWSIRRTAVQLIAKVGTPEAVAALIPVLADGDSDVRSAASTALSSAHLDETSLSALTAVFKSNEWSIRVNALQFIAKIPGAKSMAILISALADSDSDVRSKGATFLKDRQLTDTEVPLFVAIAKSSEWSIRRSAAVFLGTIQTSAATSALVTMLIDGDADVRASVIAGLAGRALGDNDIEALGVQLNAGDWGIRQIAARVLGTTSSCRAVSLLMNRLLNESDADVSAEIKKSVASIRSRNSSCQ